MLSAHARRRSPSAVSPAPSRGGCVAPGGGSRPPCRRPCRPRPSSSPRRRRRRPAPRPRPPGPRPPPPRAGAPPSPGNLRPRRPDPALPHLRSFCKRTKEEMNCASSLFCKARPRMTWGLHLSTKETLSSAFILKHFNRFVANAHCSQAEFARTMRLCIKEPAGAVSLQYHSKRQWTVKSTPTPIVNNTRSTHRANLKHGRTCDSSCCCFPVGAFHLTPRTHRPRPVHTYSQYAGASREMALRWSVKSHVTSFVLRFSLRIMCKNHSQQNRSISVNNPLNSRVGPRGGPPAVQQFFEPSSFDASGSRSTRAVA